MSNWQTLIPLVLLIVIMYFMLIRPQRKRERDVNNMRNAVKVGDEVVTIGGICGKIVKTKDDVLTIQVGADKTKFDIMRWAISKVVTGEAAPKTVRPPKSAKVTEDADEAKDSDAEDIAASETNEEEAKPTLPKRLKKKTAEEEAGIEE